MGDPNLWKTYFLQEWLGYRQNLATRQWVLAATVPLCSWTIHLPLLPQLLHPSSLPVAPVFPPSFFPPPLFWGVPFFRIHSTGRVSKGFQTEDGEWRRIRWLLGRQCDKGKRVSELPKQQQVWSYIKTVQVVPFYPVNRAANLAEETHLKAFKSAQWPGTVRLVSLCDALLNVMCHHKSWLLQLLKP